MIDNSNDHASVLRAVQHEGESLKNASIELRDAREIVMAAVNQNPSALQYASDRIKNDRTVVLCAVKRSGDLLQCASKALRNDNEVVLAAVRQDGWAIAYASKALRGNREVMLAAVSQNANALKFASKSLKGDRELALEAATQHGHALEYISPALRSDRAFAKAAAKTRASSLRYVGKSLLTDQSFVLEALRTNAACLPHAPESLRSDPNFLLKAIASNALVLSFTSEEFKCSKQFVLSAVDVNGDALVNASPELRSDPEIILKAIGERGSALRFVTPDIEDYRGYVLAAVNKNGAAIRFASDQMKNDREIAFATVSLDGCLLQYLSAAMRADRYVVERAVLSSWKALGVADESLKASPDIVLAAAKQSSKALGLASSSLRNDPDFVLKAMVYDREALYYSDKRLKKSREFLKAAIERDGLAWTLLPKRFVNDFNLAEIAVTQSGAVLRSITDEIKKAERKAQEMICDFVNGIPFSQDAKTMQKFYSYGERVSELYSNYGKLCRKAVSQHGQAIVYVNLRYLAEGNLSANALLSSESTGRTKVFQEYRLIATSALIQDSKVMKYLPRSLTMDESFVLDAIKTAGAAVLEFASPIILNDLDFSMKAAALDGHSIKYFNAENQNRALVMTAVTTQGSSLEHANPLLQNDRSIALTAVLSSADALSRLKPPLKNDRSFWLEVVGMNIEGLRHIPEAIKVDSDFWIRAIEINAGCFEHVPKAITSEEQFLLQALAANAGIAEYIPKAHRSRRDFALSAVSVRGEFLGNLAEELKTDADILGAALSQSGCALEFVESSVSNYRCHVITAVRQCGLSIRFAVGFQQDHEIALAAVSSASGAFKYVAEELQSSREFIIRALVLNPESIAHVESDMIHDRDFLKEVLRRNGLIWELIPSQFLSDIELALIAVSSDGSTIQQITTAVMGRNPSFSHADALQYLGWIDDGKVDLVDSTSNIIESDLLKHYEELSIAAVEQDAGVFRFVQADLVSDESYRRIALAAVAQDVNVVEMIREPLLRDHHFMLEALRASNASVLRFAHPTLTSRYSFVSDAVEIDGFALNYSVRQRKSSLLAANRSFSEDRELVLKAVKSKGSSIKFASEMYHQDREVAICAVKQDGNALKFLHQTLRNDREIVEIAVKQCEGALAWASLKFQDDISIVQDAVRGRVGHAMQHASRRLRSDASFMLAILDLSSFEALEYADHTLRNDLSFAREVVALDGNSLALLDEQLKADRDLALAAIKSKTRAFSFAATSLSNDRFFVLAAVDIDGLVLQYVPENLRNDREVCRVALESSGAALQFVPQPLRNDRSLVIAALKNDPDSLMHCAAKFKNDLKIISMVVKARGTALRHCPKEVWTNQDIVIDAISQDWRTIQHGPDFVKRDQLLLRRAAICDAQALKYAPTELLSDKDFIRSIVKSQGYALRYASEELRRDPSLVSTAIDRDPIALKHADKSLRRDRAVVAIAVKRNAWAVLYADKSLREDLDLALIAIVGDEGVLEQLGTEIKSDSAILSIASQVQRKDRRLAALYLAAQRGAVHAIRSLVVGEQDASEIVTKWLKGGTMLHHAAANGRLETCRALIEEFGTPLLSRDSAGNSALTIAVNNERAAVVDYLAGLKSVFEASAGDGSVLQEALRDPRSITRVEWRIRTLPSWTAGARQSLLVVLVQDDLHNEHAYTVEKSLNSCFPKGVLISNFKDIVSEEWKLWRREDWKDGVVASNIIPGMTMGDLYVSAIDGSQIDYNVVTCNCHHLVQHVFNRVSSGSQIDHLPEVWGKMFATRVPHPTCRLLAAFGEGVFQPTQSKNRGFRLSLRHAKSMPAGEFSQQLLASDAPGSIRVRGEHPFPEIGERCPNERHRWVSKTVALSEWILNSDPALFSITSKLAFEVRVIVEDGEETDIAPGETILIQAARSSTGVPSMSSSARNVLDLLKKDSTTNLRVELPNPKGVGGPLIEVFSENVKAGATYILQHRCDIGRTIDCEMMSESRLPKGVDLCGTVHKAPNGITWAVLKQEGSDTAFVVFSADLNPFQAETEIASEPVAVPAEGSCLKAHGCYWNALQMKPAVIVLITEVLEAHGIIGSHDLVFCGHSIGGSYALLSALEFLRLDGIDRVSAIHCFGAPQTFCRPPSDSPEYVLWNELDRITTVYVNEWDIVPRLPSCTAWVDSTIASPEVLEALGFSQERAENMKNNIETLGTYRPTGGVMFVGVGRETAMSALPLECQKSVRKFSTDSDIARMFHEAKQINREERINRSDESYHLLNLCPALFGRFVAEQHSIADYVAAIGSLRLTTDEEPRSQTHRKARPKRVGKLMGTSQIAKSIDSTSEKVSKSGTIGRLKRRLKIRKHDTQ